MTAPATAPLWPQPIEIIGLTGEYASGKTLFGLTIEPKSTLVYDEEKSSATYTSLGFERVDLFTAVLAHFEAEAAAKNTKPKDIKPIDIYLWWLDQIRALPDGKYRVILLDTVGTIESGLADWVDKNPERFGHTRAQYQRMQGLFWGDVKEHWKFVLNLIASKCETFVFTSHMTNVWKGSEPTGKRKPKGKETLMELASLYLMMERKADAKGNLPAKPSAVVLKTRLMSHRINEATGEIEIVPTLPPRLPVATPHSIRQYMLQPPDYSKLSDEERVNEERMTDDEKLQLQASIANANRDTEQLRLDRAVKEEKNIEAKAANRNQPRQVAQANTMSAATPTPATTPTQSSTPAAATVVQQSGSAASSSSTPSLTTSTPPATAAGPISGATDLGGLPADRTERLLLVKKYKDDLAITAEQWKVILSKRNVATAKDLDDAQLNELIHKLAHRITANQVLGNDGSPLELQSAQNSKSGNVATAAKPAAGQPFSSNGSTNGQHVGSTASTAG